MRIAIIGSGISGLGAAWSLAGVHELTLYEAESRLGGHTHTLDVTVQGRSYAVDSGFMVFNPLTYPHLLALFRELGIGWRDTDMSLSVRIDKQDFEWSGQSFSSLFADRRNLVRPAFWRLLADVVRFNRMAPAWLEQHPQGQATLGELVTAWGFSAAFREAYLLPMAAAIWSCPARTVWDFPAATFIRFCVNHRLLQVNKRPTWRTVLNGSRSYIEQIRPLLGDIRLQQQVVTVRSAGQGVEIGTVNGVEVFDRVILACHSDQASQLLAHDDPRRQALQAIPYQNNRIVVHTDSSFMPRHRAAWSAWNVHAGADADSPVAVTYWLNRLQGIQCPTPILQTLNPYREPAAGSVLADFCFAHPLLDANATFAQQNIEAQQGAGGIWLAGAWLGYGFHEDGLKSGLRAAIALGGRVLHTEPAP